ncbi:hypothetical protein [Hymenobacter jejuensis]|uniref:Uncharacterized protein n=1 Tax=Hymenobacter jejuensis TaxID=2502781 RepID=A0A5B8A0T1_9BACT|nr:hypothetical protein [Hymenobacter jejuensis]QDA60699.1 hypothetical protein FHG12_11555 [Hymenobacter jejuensis]
MAAFVAQAQQPLRQSVVIRLSPEDQDRGQNGVQNNFFFTTGSGSDYQNAGFFGQRLRPYLADDQEAIANLNHYRRQKWMYLGERALFVSSVALYGQQVLAGDKQQYFNNTQKAAIGIAAVSLLSNVFITRNTNQHMQRAVQAHNGNLPSARRAMLQRLAPTGVGLGAASTGQPQLALRWSLR